MRDELHVMELVDRYLDGEMGETERAAFEERMRTNGELHGMVDDQRALREGLHRVQLRTALASAHRTWTVTRWLPWMAAGLIILAVGAWFMRPPAEHDAHAEVAHVEESDVPKAPETVIVASDTFTEPSGMDARIETVFTCPPLQAENWADTARGDVVPRCEGGRQSPEEARRDRVTGGDEHGPIG